MFVASTEFSIGHSLLSYSDVIKIADEHELDKVIVADTMSVTTMIPLTEKLGERLITGVRVTVVDEAIQERLPIYQPKVYPMNEAAMQLVYRYLSRSFERPFYYEVPRLDLASFYEMLSEGDFYVSTGDINSLLTHSDYSSIMDRVEELVGPTNLIYDICPVPTARADRINHTALKYCREANQINIYIPAFYKQEDADVYPIHYSINKNVEFNFLKPHHQDFYYAPERHLRMFAQMYERIKARYAFEPTIKYNRFDWSIGPFYRWAVQAPKLPQLSSDPAGTLRKLSIEGFKSRLLKPTYGYQPTKEDLVTVYRDRLQYELDALETLGFCDYFLLVYELTSWCKGQDIKIGPGRGSVGGSLVAYCLGITDVDPIRFGLMFERFINPTRIDLPDIDLDFMSTRRHEIVEHLNDRYGSDNVAGIINYANLGSKSALRSTCRILGLPDNEYACSKLIPSNFGFTTPLIEAREKVMEVATFANVHPDPWNKALKLEGKLRNFSTHAAGIIVSNRPLVNDAVIEVRSGSRIINWDKKLCEKQGLIKLDVLGLTTLDIIDLCLSYIKSRHGVLVDINSIRLDDKATLDEFAKSNTGGVFQFEGGSVKKLLSGLAKSGNITFDDLVAANALNRPGPIEAGLVQQYIDGKNGELHDVTHESMAEILEPTFNVMVYQEQIMKVSVEYAGYTMPESDNLRKIMGKKLPEEMKKEASKFISGAVAKHGVPEEQAEALFDQISKFAMYAFNKSHSVEYSLLSYICMWLKVYYRVEFYAASLTYVDDKKVRSIINEARKNGIRVDPPSINYSTDKFAPASAKRIVAPLSKIKYVQAAASKIMEERKANGPFTSIEDIQARIEKRIVNKRVIDGMTAVGALDELLPELIVDPEERSRALNEWLPSIPLGSVMVSRPTGLTKASEPLLMDLLGELKADDKNLVLPFIGSKQKFMVVFDSATATEAKNGEFTDSKGFTSVARALAKADLRKTDAYWTGLVKRQKAKSEKIFSNEILEASFKTLKREIEILKPIVIVCLGSAVSRMFDPAMKGGPSDNCGRIVYDASLDCNIVFGFNPSTLFFNPDMAPILDELFEEVAELI